MPDRFLTYLQDVWNFLQTLFLWAVMFLLPINSFIGAVVALITIDLITGVWASLKNKEKLTAKRMAKTVNKFLLYSLAIIAAYILQYIGDEGIGLPRIVAMYVGAIELKSILLENIPKIMGKNIFLNLWHIIKGKVEEMITGISIKNNSNDTTTDHQ
jgi:phage-related holin